MLRGGKDRGTAATAVKKAMLRCGAALQAEFEAQEKDFLAEMPCHLLISAGRKLVELRTSEREAMERLHAVVSEIARELELIQQSVDNAGVLWKRKDAAVEEFGKASKRVKKTHGMRDLVLAQIRIQEADDDDDADGGDTITELGVQLAAREGELHLARAQKRLAFGELAAVEPDFPEVMVHLEKALPRELLGVWRPDCALEEMFVKREKLAGTGRHDVWRCSDGLGGEEFAVKEYLHKPDLRACLREAALLMRLRHPAIVSVVAVFQDTTTGTMMLQMPFYPHGSVDEWVKDAPGWIKVRTVLQDVTGALAHLHVNHVVHSDIKPPNILVGPGERGKLADFDISVDSRIRTTQQYLVTTRVRVGWTAGFEAPELQQTGSTAATDMFALGKTLSQLREWCIDEESATSAGDVDALVRVLTANAGAQRPSADAAANHAFFKPLLAFRREQTSNCCICLELKRHSEGAVCAEGHLTCTGCMQGHVHTCAGQELRLLREREGRVSCPNRGQLGCSAAPFSDSELGHTVSAEVFDSYLKARMQLLESIVREAMEEDVERRMNEELERLRTLDEGQRKVLVARRYVEEEVLTSKCPRCRTAFLDFEGCCALKCSRCPCQFCAWCGVDCGADAHRHVASCAAKPAGADVYYPGSRQDFERAQALHRAPKLETYLRTLENETRGSLLRDIKGMLGELYSQVLRVFGV